MNLTDFNKTAAHWQKCLLLAKERFLVALTGIQAGKTTVGAVWLCKGIYDDYTAGIKTDYLIAAPTVKVLQQSTLPKFLEIIPKDWGEWKEGAKVFALKWGSRIFVRSTDSPDLLEGMTIRRAWLDEAGQMKQVVWTNVQGRLSINQGPCLLTTTPYAMGWFNRELVKRAHSENAQERSQGDANIALFTGSSLDNPAFPREEFERARVSLAPAVFERRYLGRFTRLEGLVYPEATDNIIEPFAVPGDWERWSGMDFGHTNPTAIIVVVKDPVNKINYAIKEFYKAETVLAQSAMFIQDNALRVTLADPQSRQLIEELRRAHRIVVEQADNDIDLGVERITALFRAGQLKIFNTCTNLIDELENYHYATPDDEGSVKDKPVAKNNHACDALRYAFSKQRGRLGKGFNPLEMELSGRRSVPGQLFRHEIVNDSWTGY